MVRVVGNFVDDDDVCNWDVMEIDYLSSKNKYHESRKYTLHGTYV